MDADRSMYKNESRFSELEEYTPPLHVNKPYQKWTKPYTHPPWKRSALPWKELIKSSIKETETSHDTFIIKNLSKIAQMKDWIRESKIEYEYSTRVENPKINIE